MGGSTLGTTQEMKQINAIGAFMTSVSQEQTGFLLAWETEDYFLDYVHSKNKKKQKKGISYVSYNKLEEFNPNVQSSQHEQILTCKPLHI